MLRYAKCNFVSSLFNVMQGPGHGLKQSGSNPPQDPLHSVSRRGGPGGGKGPRSLLRSMQEAGAEEFKVLQ